MLKQEIKWHDEITDEDRSEVAYFNLNKAEQFRIIGRAKNMEWEDYVKSVVETQDSDKIMDLFESVIGAAYGIKKKDADGNERFVKSKDATDGFLASDAYGELFMTFVMDQSGETARKFFAAVGGTNANASALEANVKSVAKKNTK